MESKVTEITVVIVCTALHDRESDIRRKWCSHHDVTFHTAGVTASVITNGDGTFFSLV